LLICRLTKNHQRLYGGKTLKAIDNQVNSVLFGGIACAQRLKQDRFGYAVSSSLLPPHCNELAAIFKVSPGYPQLKPASILATLGN